MSNLVISGATAKPTPEEILKFEVQLGCRLPEDYREFLLAYNGGTTSPCDFMIPGSTANPYSGLHELFSLSKNTSDNSLIKYNIILQGRVPDNMLPIGADDTGNFICLKTSGLDRGSIYFWDHDEERFPADHSNLYRLADSFDDFLASLRDHVD